MLQDGLPPSLLLLFLQLTLCPSTLTEEKATTCTTQPTAMIKFRQQQQKQRPSINLAALGSVTFQVSALCQLYLLQTVVAADADAAADGPVTTACHTELLVYYSLCCCCCCTDQCVKISRRTTAKTPLVDMDRLLSVCVCVFVATPTTTTATDRPTRHLICQHPLHSLSFPFHPSSPSVCHLSAQSSCSPHLFRQ